MKRFKFLGILALTLCIALSVGVFAGVSAAENEAPKNVILLIGDGMGPNQVNAAHDHIGEDLNMETMPYKGQSSTSNVSGGVTDSAAGGTALACGVKTVNDRIGMDSMGNPVSNIREEFANLGKKTGLVSTTNITDATPAAFGAHNMSRSNQKEIAAEFIDKEIDLLMGGGGDQFDTALRNTAVNDKGYTIVSHKNELQSFDGSTKLLALFHGGSFPYYADGYPENIPTIAEMTVKAIEILNQNNDGFFLMVEGARIDHACHAQDLARTISETIEFDKAVKVAMDFAEQDGNTLVIVTADHETGGLQKNGTNYTFSHGNHSGVDVPVFAMGKGAENFQGNMINTDIPNIIRALFENDVTEPTESTISENPTTTTENPTTTTDSDADPPAKTGENSKFNYIILFGVAPLSFAIVLAKKRVSGKQTKHF